METLDLTDMIRVTRSTRRGSLTYEVFSLLRWMPYRTPTEGAYETLIQSREASPLRRWLVSVRMTEQQMADFDAFVS